MSLKKQLLFVCLTLLFLPWAGCQYIRAIDQSLRESQMHALEAHARAVAISLQANDSLPAYLPPFANTETPSFSENIYLFPLSQNPQIDGYDSDWIDQPVTPVRYTTEKLKQTNVQLSSGKRNNQIFFFFNIKDGFPQRYDPQQPGIANGNYLQLIGGNQQWILRNSGSGQITARYINSSGAVRQEHKIRGYWLETSTGYQIELSIPSSLLGARAGFIYHTFDERSQPVIISNNQNLINDNKQFVVNENTGAPPIIEPQPDLQTLLSPYSTNNIRISILSPNYWLVSQAGELETRPQTQETFWLLRRFYQAALASEDFPDYYHPKTVGLFFEEPNESLISSNEITTQHWFDINNTRLAQVIVPLTINQSLDYLMIVEQTTSNTTTATNNAFNQLLLSSGIILFVIFAGLITYASILSYRIRKLSHATKHALDKQGKINTTLIQSSANDEIGDLARNYQALLLRLDEYTEYLRTLASKLSHELRTPLAVIRSSLENVDEKQLTNDNQQYTKRAREGVDRLSYILNAMSAASRIEESIHQSSLEKIDLAKLLNEIFPAYQSAYPDHHLQLSIDTHLATVMASPELLVQMCDKLLDNASDFCPAGGTISIALTANNSVATLTIANEGPLLPENMQAQLFDSLVSMRNETATNKTHLGLGLYIVRLIVDFHQGQVKANNLADNTGVIFTVTLPLSTK